MTSASTVCAAAERPTAAYDARESRDRGMDRLSGGRTEVAVGVTQAG
jgi:hypothetical protein